MEKDGERKTRKRELGKEKTGGMDLKREKIGGNAGWSTRFVDKGHTHEKREGEGIYMCV